MGGRMARTKRPTARTGLARATVLGVILASAMTPPGALARTIPAAAPGADAAEGAAVLVGAGDVASCGLTADEATARLLDGISGTVFVAGDTVYERGTPTEYADCYEPTWGRHRDRTRPAVGNHEYGTAGASGYFGYFGAAAGAPSQGWYAYDLGSWRVYMLNSNCAQVGGCLRLSQQTAWLRDDLARNPRTCAIAIWHHPRWSSGVHGGSYAMRGFWRALYDAGAEIVVNGHDHDYERFRKMDPSGTWDKERGLREFVVGTGGASLRSFPTVEPNSVVRGTTHGVLRLELADTGYSWTFVPVAGASFTDSGSGRCH